MADWKTYALVATIEWARTERKNPEVPAWLEKDYLHAIGELAEIGNAEIWRADDQKRFEEFLESLPSLEACGLTGSSS